MQLKSGIPKSYLDTDGTLAANSNVRVASQKAVKTYVGSTITASAVLLQATTPGTVQTGHINISGNATAGYLTLPTTTSPTTGVIYKGTDRFIHNFALTGTDGLNTFVGITAGNFTMTGSTGIQGSYNAGFGEASLIANTTGSYNAAFGFQSLYANTTGELNTGIGFNILHSNTSGSHNVAVGDSALWGNTTASFNTGVGQSALFTSSIGTYNSGVGASVLFLNTTGSYNAAMGANSLSYNTTGSGNVALGFSAGTYQADGTTPLTDPESSVYIGRGAMGKDNSDSNSIVLGYFAIGMGANTAVWGNTSITDHYFTGNVRGTTFIGALTGNASGSAATVTGAAQTAVTSLGTLTGLTIGSAAAGANATINATGGSELAPALTAGNWTVGAGWESPIVGPGLIKNADGTGTQTPSAATTIVAGTTYEVVITLSAWSVGSASYTLGGVTGKSLAAATTYTDYITASTTGKLIITPTNTSRFTISAISYIALTNATGDLNVYGNLSVFSPIQDSSGNKCITLLNGYAGFGGNTSPQYGIDVLGDICSRGTSIANIRMLTPSRSGIVLSLNDATAVLNIGSGNDSAGIAFGGGGAFGSMKTAGWFVGGTTTPTASLHIKAGTITANTAPLKFISGPVLTTPEAGAVEYDGTLFYVTPSTVRKALAVGGGSTGATVVPNGTVTLEINGTSYYLLTAAAA